MTHNASLHRVAEWVFADCQEGDLLGRFDHDDGKWDLTVFIDGEPQEADFSKPHPMHPNPATLSDSLTRVWDTWGPQNELSVELNLEALTLRLTAATPSNIVPQCKCSTRALVEEEEEEEDDITMLYEGRIVSPPSNHLDSHPDDVGDHLRSLFQRLVPSALEGTTLRWTPGGTVVTTVGEPLISVRHRESFIYV